MSNISEPVYGNSYTKTNYFELEKGDQVFRILPPFKRSAQEKKPKWSQFWKIHWGYTTSTGAKRPFASPEVVNYNTKMIEVPDAALNRIKKLEAIKAEAKKNNDQTTLDQVTTALKQFSCEKKWYMNVIDQAGKIGVLKIPHKAHEALQAEVERLQKEGANPVGVKNGRSFVFRRTGEKLDTVYQVFVYQETVDVPGMGPMKRDAISDLSDEVITRMDSEAKDLNTLYVTPTAEQVQDIVDRGAPAMDLVFPNTRRNNQSDESANTPQTQAPAVTTVPTVAAPAASIAPTYQAPVATAQNTTPTVNPALAASVAAGSNTAQANADFLKQMGF